MRQCGITHRFSMRVLVAGSTHCYANLLHALRTNSRHHRQKPLRLHVVMRWPHTAVGAGHAAQRKGELEIWPTLSQRHLKKWCECAIRVTDHILTQIPLTILFPILHHSQEFILMRRVTSWFGPSKSFIQKPTFRFKVLYLWSHYTVLLRKFYGPPIYPLAFIPKVKMEDLRCILHT